MGDDEPRPIDLLAELQAAVLGTTVARAHPPAAEWSSLIETVTEWRNEIERLRAENVELRRDLCLHTCTIRACHMDNVCEKTAAHGGPR